MRPAQRPGKPSTRLPLLPSFSVRSERATRQGKCGRNGVESMSCLENRSLRLSNTLGYLRSIVHNSRGRSVINGLRCETFRIATPKTILSSPHVARGHLGLVGFLTDYDAGIAAWTQQDIVVPIERGNRPIADSAGLPFGERCRGIDFVISFPKASSHRKQSNFSKILDTRWQSRIVKVSY